MIIKSVELKNFRNYKNEKIEFSRGINYIFGMNAQGKTNILESLYFCGCSKSHRTNNDVYLLKENEHEFYVKMNIEYEDTIQKELMIKYDENSKKKELQINGIKQKGMGELFGKVNMVFFAPEDLMLIKEGPALRRRQIDISLSQLRPAYYYDLIKYYKILKQKNNLLKEIKKNTRLLETLDVWNESLSRYGAKIIVKRIEYINSIAEIAQKKHLAISDNKEVMKIKYKASMEIKDTNDEERIFKNLYEKYKENREREIIIGSTVTGPHRDDIIFLINGNEAKGLSSQGQQRSAILSFKMAQLDLIGENIGENPILLLDDVFSELDEKRKKYIYDNLYDIQTFITGTEKDDTITSRFKDIKFFNIEKGKAEEV